MNRRKKILLFDACGVVLVAKAYFSPKGVIKYNGFGG